MRACGWLPIYMNPEAAYNERLVIGVCCYTAERAEKKIKEFLRLGAIISTG